MENGPYSVIIVTRSVVVNEDKSWSVYVFRKKVPDSCYILQGHPPQISGNDELLLIIGRVDEASLCPGNPERQFIELCHKRSGRDDNISTPLVVDIEGKQFENTVRKKDCELLITHTGRYPTPQCCNSCSAFRGKLRAVLSRQRRNIDRDHTSANSDTSFVNLTPEDKGIRLRNLQQSWKVNKTAVHIMYI